MIYGNIVASETRAIRIFRSFVTFRNVGRNTCVYVCSSQNYIHSKARSRKSVPRKINVKLTYRGRVLACRSKPWLVPNELTRRRLYIIYLDLNFRINGRSIAVMLKCSVRFTFINSTLDRTFNLQKHFKKKSIYQCQFVNAKLDASVSQFRNQKLCAFLWYKKRWKLDERSTLFQRSTPLSSRRAIKRALDEHLGLSNKAVRARIPLYRTYTYVWAGNQGPLRVLGYPMVFANWTPRRAPVRKWQRKVQRSNEGVPSIAVAIR